MLLALFIVLQTISVKVSDFPPCVIERDGHLCGFDIDLWNCLANEIGVKTNFEKVEQFSHIFDDLLDKKAQAAIAGISINAARESKIDFTHHYLDSGLRILVRRSEATPFAGYFSTLKSFGFLAGLLVVGGTLLWLIERTKGNLKTVPDGIHLAFASASTIGYGDFFPKTIPGRLTCFAIFVCGAVLFGNFVANLTAEKTAQKMSVINSQHDLVGKKVGTVKGTTSVASLKRLKAVVVESPIIEQSYKQLLDGEIDAVVYDSPSLQYFAATEGSGKVMLVGNTFDRQFYGIALPEGSDLREPLNLALLKLQENGIYEAIYQKWFGKD